MYILRNNDTGEYAASIGSEKTYTTRASKARRFASYEAAKSEACENETPVKIVLFD